MYTIQSKMQVPRRLILIFICLALLPVGALGAKVIQFGFDTDGPTGVRIGYAGLICNDFGLLDSWQIIDKSQLRASL